MKIFLRKWDLNRVNHKRGATRLRGIFNERVKVVYAYCMRIFPQLFQSEHCCLENGTEMGVYI